MKSHSLVTLAIFAALSACSSNQIASLYPMPAPVVEAARSSSKTIEVMEVSLPLYLRGQEMPLTGPDGAITTSEALLWADEPARAISLNLAQILSRMSGGVAAVEPWPLLDRAKLRLDVRVQTLVAQSNGTLRFAGQYFLVPEDEGRPKVEWFDFLVPMSASTGPEIARATGVATQELARLVLSK